MVGVQPDQAGSSLARDRSIIEHYVRPSLGGRPIGAVTRAEVQALVDGWTQAQAASTVGRQYSCLRAMFAYAEAAELIMKTPCRSIRLSCAAGGPAPAGRELPGARRRCRRDRARCHGVAGRRTRAAVDRGRRVDRRRCRRPRPDADGPPPARPRRSARAAQVTCRPSPPGRAGMARRPVGRDDGAALVDGGRCRRAPVCLRGGHAAFVYQLAQPECGCRRVATPRSTGSGSTICGRWPRRR